MRQSSPAKVLVTNPSALRAKYGAAYNKQIKPAVNALIAADKGRGLTTVLVALDDANTMTRYGGKAVTTADDPKQNKQAIDAVFKTLRPAYLCVLGSVDVVPHQDLKNPLNDGDPAVPSDLPYACDHAYSTTIEDFLALTRVVGRLPDLTGGKDASYLVGLLTTAGQYKTLPPAQYTAYLGVTAQVWQASTEQSLANVFGNHADLQVVPPAGPPWAAALMGRRSQFINCHGAPADPRFYGQQGNDYPPAYDAAQLAGFGEGTVLAAECCYGAELYDPAAAGGRAGVCNTCLAAKAYGFFGSSTIAYGPSSGNGQADVICQLFLRSVLAGASLGRAALQARQDFLVGLSGAADPSDLKTLAQFGLMGDPAVQPVAAPAAGRGVVAAGTAKAMAAAAVDASAAAVTAAQRPERRLHLEAVGRALGAATACVATDSRTDAPPAARRFSTPNWRGRGPSLKKPPPSRFAGPTRPTRRRLRRPRAPREFGRRPPKRNGFTWPLAPCPRRTPRSGRCSWRWPESRRVSTSFASYTAGELWNRVVASYAGRSRPAPKASGWP